VKKVKWPVVQLFEKKLRKILRDLKHMMSAWVKKEKIRGVEFILRPLTKKFTIVNQRKGEDPLRGENEVKMRDLQEVS
jgi:hypothetical protein